MHFICRSFIGKSEGGFWSRYWENESDDASIKFSKGHLFALVNLHSSIDQDLNALGHNLITEFNQNYFESNPQAFIPNSLAQSLETILSNPIFSTIEIDLVAVVVINHQLYSFCFGNTKLILKRHQQVSILIDNFNQTPQVINGIIDDHDRLLLSSGEFFQQIGWDNIKTFISDPKIQSLEENFLSSLYSLNDQKFVSAAFIQADYDDQEITSSLDQVITPVPDTNLSQNNFSITPKKSLLSSIFANFKKDSVYISSSQSKQQSRRYYLKILFCVISFLALSLSLFFGIRQAQIKKSETSYQKIKVELETKIENINQLKGLNFDDAKSVAQTANGLVDQMSKLKIHSDEVALYQQKIDQFLAQTGDESSPQASFYDLSQINKDASYSSFIFQDQKLYLLDHTNGRLDSLIISNKNEQPISADAKLKSALDFTLTDSKFYLLFSDNISLLDKNTITSKIKFADSSDNITPTAFDIWNSAIYVLDSTNQSVLKFNPNSTGFSKAQTWLKDGQKTAANANSISIDSQIWVLSSTGQITPYLSGKKELFTLNQSQNFVNTTNLAVAPDGDYLAFVDNQQIVYVVKKTGELILKSNLGKIKIADITLDSANKLLYVLGQDQKIYSLNF